jgi:hypothetical protein
LKIFNVQEQKKLISENELPIPVPSTDIGWKHMREQLDDEMPEIAIIPLVHSSRRSSRKSKRGLILLIALLLIGFVTIEVIRNDTNKTTNTSPTKQSKESYQNAGGTENKSPKETISSTNSVQNNGASNNTNENATIHNTKIVQQLHQTERQTKKLNDQNAGITSAGAKKKITRKAEDQDQKQDFADLEPAVAIVPGNDQYIAKDSTRTPLPGLNTAQKKQPPGKTDSAAVASPQTADGWKLNGGIAWTIQIPGSGHAYFSGSNTKSQPHKILLPGLWLQAEQDKHLLNLEANPFASNLVPSRTFRSFTTIEAIPGTIVTTTQSRTLSKLFGVTASLGYAYNIHGHWWIGGNLRACIWTKAIASSKGEIRKDPVTGIPGAVTIPFRNNYRIHDEWSYFSKFQFYLHAETIYRKEKWQAGLRAGIAATTLSKDEGPAHPFQAELFYRFKLWNNADKKKKGSWNQ